MSAHSKADYKSVVGVFRNRASADAFFSDLLARGYSRNEVNVMMSDQTRARDYAWKETELVETPGGTVVARTTPHETLASPNVAPERKGGTTAGSQAAEGVALGGSLGTAVGATIAAIAAIGTSLVIPGLNIIVAGPIVAALAGGGAGAVTGGLVGGLVGMGIAEQDAQVYNRALAEGGVVLSVHARDSKEASAVKDLMMKHSGEQVTVCACL